MILWQRVRTTGSVETRPGLIVHRAPTIAKITVSQDRRWRTELAGRTSSEDSLRRQRTLPSALQMLSDVLWVVQHWHHDSELRDSPLHRQQWARVLFTDKSTFALEQNDDRSHVWRRTGNEWSKDRNFLFFRFFWWFWWVPSLYHIDLKKS